MTSSSGRAARWAEEERRRLRAFGAYDLRDLMKARLPGPTRSPWPSRGLLMARWKAWRAGRAGGMGLDAGLGGEALEDEDEECEY